MSDARIFNTRFLSSLATQAESNGQLKIGFGRHMDTG